MKYISFIILTFLFLQGIACNADEPADIQQEQSENSFAKEVRESNIEASIKSSIECDMEGFSETFQISPVEDNDPQLNQVNEFNVKKEEELKDRLPHWVEYHSGPPQEISSDLLKSLFPNHRFFLVWGLHKHHETPPGERRVLGLPAEWKWTIAIDRQGHVTSLYSRVFGDFLADNKIQLPKGQNIEVFRDAYAMILHDYMQGETIQVSENVWRLGIKELTPREGGPGIYFIEVRLNPDKTVQLKLLREMTEDAAQVSP